MTDTGSVHGNRLLQIGKTNRSETYVSIVSSTGESGLLFADTTTNDTGGYRGQIRYHHSDDSMNFRTGATERVRITSGGYVGMNLDANPDGNATLTPWTNHVVGSNVADKNARNNSNPTGQLHVSSSGLINQGGTISLGSGDNVNPNAYASISGRRFSATSYHYQGYLTLNDPDGTTLDEKVRIKSDGKVGINQTSPNAPLSFNTGVGQKIELYNQGSNNEFGIGVQSSELRISSGTNSRISFFTNGYNGNERLRIDSDGYVLQMLL